MTAARASPVASLALLSLAMFGALAARTVLSPLQELMQADLALSDSQVSLIQGAAISVPLAVLSIPLGRLIDGKNRARLLVALAVMGAAGTALTAVASNFTMMLIARVIVGIAVGASLPTAVSLAADLSDAGNRSKVVGLLGMGQILGAAAAFFLAGWLLGHVPDLLHMGSRLSSPSTWRSVQLVFALAMLAGACLLLTLREPPRQEVEAADITGLRAVLVELAGHRAVLLPLVVGMITITMADAAANVWAVPVLTRFLHLRPEDFGSWMGTLMLLTGAVGVVLGGYLGDLGQRFWGRPGILAAATLVACLSVPTSLFPIMTTTTGFAALFGFLMLFGTASGIICAAALTVLIPNELRGISFSLVATVGSLIGLGLSPLLVTLVANVGGYGDDVRIPLTIVGLATSVISTLATFVAMRAAQATPNKIISAPAAGNSLGAKL